MVIIHSLSYQLRHLKRFMSFPDNLSASKLTEFTTCGQKFKFHYVDKVPEQPHDYFLRGKVVHRALEIFYQRPPEQRMVIDALRQDLQEAIDGEHADPAWAHDMMLLGVTWDDCWELTRRIFQVEQPSQVDVVATEFEIQAVIDGHAYRGIIDRVDREPDGSLTIVDYKCGKTPPVSRVHEKLRQLMLYAAMYRIAGGETPATVKLIYLRGTEKKQLPVIYTEPVATEDVLFIEGRSAAIANAIDLAYDGEGFRPAPGFLCPSCDYREMCPAWPQG